jgi:hypothetical protein
MLSDPTLIGLSERADRLLDQLARDRMAAKGIRTGRIESAYSGIHLPENSKVGFHSPGLLQRRIRSVAALLGVLHQHGLVTSQPAPNWGTRWWISDRGLQRLGMNRSQQEDLIATSRAQWAVRTKSVTSK